MHGETRRGETEDSDLGWVTHDCQKGSKVFPSVHAPAGEYSIRGLTLSNVTFTVCIDGVGRLGGKEYCVSVAGGGSKLPAPGIPDFFLGISECG